MAAAMQLVLVDERRHHRVAHRLDDRAAVVRDRHGAQHVEVVVHEAERGCVADLV